MRAFYCCIACIVVIDAEKVDRSRSTFTLSRRQRMLILDEITKEKQRVSEALGRVDAQREKLTSQLSELEATERVLARYSKGTQARKTALATAAGAIPAPGRGRRTTTARPAGGKGGSSSLNDQVLALATGKTQQEITAACKGARPNHVGAAIARHNRAGRVRARWEALCHTAGWNGATRRSSLRPGQQGAAADSDRSRATSLRLYAAVVDR